MSTLYNDGCPICRAQRLADAEGRPMRLRDVIAASRSRGKKS